MPAAMLSGKAQRRGQSNRQTSMQPLNADGKNLDRKALDLYKDDVFPSWWRVTPTNGKATYVSGWPDNPLEREIAVRTYLEKSCDGFGVVTGELSGGLLAIDIDGPQADERYKKLAGDEYFAPGQEDTMTTTSGRDGRRQIFYRIPHSVRSCLRKVNKLVFKDNGWHETKGDANTSKDNTGQKYEELVIRYNRCQTVLPGSRHPITKKRYQFLNYNRGEVAYAPKWVMEAFLPVMEPVRFLSDTDLRHIEEDCRGTALPDKQIRGWFFGESVQALIFNKAEKLYQHEWLDGNWKDKGDGVHLQNFCPWHGGDSGTSFQLNTENGCWYCFADGVGGNIVDFRWRLKTGNIHSEAPTGADLEEVVAEIASEIGLNYPEDAQLVSKTQELPRIKLSSKDFHKQLCEIADEEWNPATRLDRMAVLAADSGRRLSGPQCLDAMQEYRYYEEHAKQNRSYKWWEGVEAKRPLIPNLLERPQQVILHSAAGVGKTSTAMALATLVGKGKTTRIRGIEVTVPKGPILYIQNDQSPSKLLEDLIDNGIDIEIDHSWFIVKRGWQVNHTMEFAAWVREYKPALVIIDSIGSCTTASQVQEKDKAFANPFYWYSEKNGDPSKDGFPPTTILWIHHDNANGELRGSRQLAAAVDETWRMRKLTDDERTHLREKSINPNLCRFVEIGKSRMGREGDRLIVQRDENLSYSISDFTPTEKRDADGQGDPDPTTSALRIVRDDSTSGGTGLTAKSVWEKLVEEISRRGAKPPSSRSVRRWLDRWVDRNMLVAQKSVVEDSTKPVIRYLLPNNPSLARVKCDREVSFVKSPSKTQSGTQIAIDTSEELSNAPEADTIPFLSSPPDHDLRGLQPEQAIDKPPESEDVSNALSQSETGISGSNCQLTDSCTHTREAENEKPSVLAELRRSLAAEPESDLDMDYS